MFSFIVSLIHLIGKAAEQEGESEDLSEQKDLTCLADGDRVYTISMDKKGYPWINHAIMHGSGDFFSPGHAHTVCERPTLSIRPDGLPGQNPVISKWRQAS
jgi:hypothetical protein